MSASHGHIRLLGRERYCRTPDRVRLSVSLPDLLELLKIRPETPSALPSTSTMPAIIEHTATAEMRQGTEYPRLDDGDTESRSKAIKREVDAEDHTPKSSIKRRCTLPVPKAETTNDHKDLTTTTPVSGKPPAKHDKHKSASTTIKIEDDEIEIVNVRPASHAQPKQASTQPTVAATDNQFEDPAQRDRKKAILKKRLEVLRAEQELLEMED